MTPGELELWVKDFAAFFMRTSTIFARSKPREQAVKSLRGLLSPISCKNSWQVAERRWAMRRPTTPRGCCIRPNGIQTPHGNGSPLSWRPWVTTKALGW